MSALDFGGASHVNDDARYYSASGPALTGSFSIWAWVKNDYVADTNQPSVMSRGNARGAGTNSFDIRYDCSLDNWVFTSFDSAGTTISNRSYAMTHEDAADGTLYLVAVTRSSSTIRLYCIPKGGDASNASYYNEYTSGGTGTINAGTTLIGGYSPTFGTNNAWRDLLGECGMVSGTALSTSQLTAMAAGARPAISVDCEWRFRDGDVTTEANLGTGGSSYDATKTGADFTTGANFWDEGPAPRIITPTQSVQMQMR
jgi:hypothetical protein